jgi:hypothetical protein
LPESDIAHPESEISVLQPIHEKVCAVQASSLYCVWITEKGNRGSRLIAVWIDSSMGAFEKECALGAEEEAVEIGPDEPGGLLTMASSIGMKIF